MFGKSELEGEKEAAGNRLVPVIEKATERAAQKGLALRPDEDDN
jgi:hypothetical protein